MSRRRLLGMAGAVAAGAAGALVASAAPAGASDPDDIVLGVAGQSTSTPTGITAPLPAGTTWRVDNTATTGGGAIAIHATNNSVDNSATVIKAESNGFSPTGATFGIHGTSNSTVGTGVAGEHLNSTGLGYGVTGGSESDAGIGVFGGCAAGNGVTIGVKGDANSSANGTGVRGEGGFVGVFAQSAAGIGVWADGGLAPLRLVPHIGAGAPTTGTHQRGELYTANTGGDIFHCRNGGTPGDWSKLNDQVSGVGFNALPAPSRVYDSRVGQPNPSNSMQGLLTFAGGARVINCLPTTPNLPAGTVGIVLSASVADTSGAVGSVIIWANGASQPNAVSLTWAGNGVVNTGIVITACNNVREVQARCTTGISTNLVIDVVGFYM